MRPRPWGWRRAFWLAEGDVARVSTCGDTRHWESDMPRVMVAAYNELDGVRLGGKPVVERFDRAQAEAAAAVRSEVATVHQDVAWRQRWQLVFKAVRVGDAHDADLVGQLGQRSTSVRRRVAVEQERGDSC